MKNSFQGLLSKKQFFNVMTCASKEITFLEPAAFHLALPAFYAISTKFFILL